MNLKYIIFAFCSGGGNLAVKLGQDVIIQPEEQSNKDPARWPGCVS